MNSDWLLNFPGPLLVLGYSEIRNQVAIILKTGGILLTFVYYKLDSCVS